MNKFHKKIIFFVVKDSIGLAILSYLVTLLSDHPLNPVVIGLLVYFASLGTTASLIRLVLERLAQE